MRFAPETLEDEDAFAGGLRVEEAVGVFGLLEAPAMGEQLAQRHLAVGDEAGAFLLAGVGEGPGGVERDLAAEEILADFERHVVALTDEGDAAPRVGAAYGLRARLREARAVHRALRTVAVGQVVDRADGIGLAWVDRVLGAQIAGQRQPFRRDVD